MIVDAPEGMSLVFPQTGPPYHQLLQLMVLQLGPDDREENPSRRATEVVYDGKTLIGSDVPSRLTRGTITQRFGPSFARREQRSSSAASRMTAHEGQVTYPGVIFSTKAEEEDVVRSIAVVARGKEEELFVRTYMERLSGGKGPWEVWKSPEKGVEGSIAYCEIHVSPLSCSRNVITNSSKFDSQAKDSLSTFLPEPIMQSHRTTLSLATPHPRIF